MKAHINHPYTLYIMHTSNNWRCQWMGTIPKNWNELCIAALHAAHYIRLKNQHDVIEDINFCLIINLRASNQHCRCIGTIPNFPCHHYITWIRALITQYGLDSLYNKRTKGVSQRVHEKIFWIILAVLVVQIEFLLSTVIDSEVRTIASWWEYCLQALGTASGSFQLFSIFSHFSFSHFWV
jgi:hypothetical protein